MAVFTGWLLMLFGVGLAVGGAWLAILGGSVYYLSAALGLVLSGGLLVARRPGALWVYALLLAGTLAWSLWEVGLDTWALFPRSALIAAIGLWLVLPWVTRGLYSGGRPAPWVLSALPLALAVAAALVVAIRAAGSDLHDRPGRLPTAPSGQADQGVADGDWPAYGRTAQGQRYSPLGRITPDNVQRLKRAWVYHTGDPGGPGANYEVTPLKIGDSLYLCTPGGRAIALDADTGAPLWTFDPHSERRHQICRGLAYFPGHADNGTVPADNQEDDRVAASGGEAERIAAHGFCEQRLFLPTGDARLIALDPDTGKRCLGFGDHGEIDLWAHMPNRRSGLYYVSSPPAVAGNRLIVGGLVQDNVSTTEPSGVIRAYDVHTGKLLWNWDSGNPDHTDPIADGGTYTQSTPNSWSVASVDERLGLVYLPMGNEVPDQWGEHRNPQSEQYASSVVALDIDTGRVRWVFQTVHHDLWDMDVPAQPSLLTLNTDHGPVPALVQPTKQGDLYVLDRRTGRPLLPVREQPAPSGPGPQKLAGSQPSSALNFDPPPLTARDLWGLTPFDQLACRIAFRRLHYRGRYTPPSEAGSLIYPGNFGVFNWGGIAVDPVRQVAFATPSFLAFVSTLVPRANDRDRYVSDGDSDVNENHGAPFAVKLKPFLSPLGLPCQQPPWGYVAGADLRTGEVAWMHRNGTVRDRSPIPLPFKLGVPDLGGPIITAGGLAFMSGTLDNYVRAFDVTSGRQLWRARLPAGGQATPITYLDSQGNQILLVVAGGHGGLGTTPGDAVIAYKLARPQ